MTDQATTTTRPIRILHVFGPLVRAGSELRTLDVTRYIDRERFQIDFCSLSDVPGSLDAEIRQLGGKVHLLPTGWTLAGRFRRLLREGHYDIVHAHLHDASGFFLRLAWRERVQGRICHFRITSDCRENTLRRRLQRWIMRRWIDRYATNILAVGEGTMAEAWSRNWRADSRCQVVYNGLDLRGFSAVPECMQSVHAELRLHPDAKIIIQVANMHRNKNHTRTLDVFRALQRYLPGAVLLLVGRPTAAVKSDVEDRIRELGLGACIVCLGVRNDVPRLLAASSLMLHPSKSEGLPGVVLEACASGLPVLASDLPGVREISAHFPRVRYLSLQCDDEKWAREALALVDSSDSRPGGVEAQRAFAESLFGIERCTQEIAAIWTRATLRPI